MTTAATALPLLGLRITAGPVESRGITDDLLGPLDQLDARCITSAAFADTGTEQRARQGQPATLHRILLEPANLVRYGHPLSVTGLAEFRQSIGLDDTNHGEHT